MEEERIFVLSGLLEDANGMPASYTDVFDNKKDAVNAMINWRERLLEHGDSTVKNAEDSFNNDDRKEVKEYTWSKSDFYFVDKPCEKRNPGYPLDSISIVPEFNKYLVELTEEEKTKNNRKNRDDGVIKFIVNNMN